MWCNHSFSQRNKATKRAGGRLGKIGKREGWQYKGLGTHCQLRYTSEDWFQNIHLMRKFYLAALENSLLTFVVGVLGILTF